MPSGTRIRFACHRNIRRRPEAWSLRPCEARSSSSSNRGRTATPGSRISRPTICLRRTRPRRSCRCSWPAGRLGVVILSFEAPRTFDADQRRFMLSASRQIAQALLRARTFERAEKARAEGEAFRVRAGADLRERQKAEEALRESEAKYRALAARTDRLYALSAGLSEAITLDAVAKVDRAPGQGRRRRVNGICRVAR